MKRMCVSTETKHRVIKKIADCLTKLEFYYSIKLDHPTVLFEKRGMVAATANSSSWLININPILLNENTDEFIENTIPHEVAHLVCDKVYPELSASGSAHGPQWRRMMDILGAKAETFHRYDVTNSRMPRTNTLYRYACTKCDKTFDLGSKRHARLITNPTALWHTKCGEDANLRFIEEVVVPPVQAVQAPVEIPSKPAIVDYFKMYTREHEQPKRNLMTKLTQTVKLVERRNAAAYEVCKLNKFNKQRSR